MASHESPALRQVRFHNPQLAGLGIEPLTLASIRSKLKPEVLVKAERVELYVLIFVTQGRGEHRVDFQRYRVSAGSVLFVRPGQVQQWSSQDNYCADVILFDPAALPSTDVWRVMADREQLSVLEWQTCLALKGDDKACIADDMARLQKDFSHYDGSELDNVLIRSQLIVVLMRLARCQRNSVGQGRRVVSKRRRVFSDFIHELEANFATEHAVQYYVRRLGYSESTLNRACRSECGHGAKAAIDTRIALEAQRLIAHSEWSIAEVAHALGFSEVTNFSKFFKRLVGSTPAGFRDERLGDDLGKAGAV